MISEAKAPGDGVDQKALDRLDLIIENQRRQLPVSTNKVGGTVVDVLVLLSGVRSRLNVENTRDRLALLGEATLEKLRFGLRDPRVIPVG